MRTLLKFLSCLLFLLKFSLEFLKKSFSNSSGLSMINWAFNTFGLTAGGIGALRDLITYHSDEDQSSNLGALILTWILFIFLLLLMIGSGAATIRSGQLAYREMFPRIGSVASPLRRRETLAIENNLQNMGDDPGCDLEAGRIVPETSSTAEEKSPNHSSESIHATFSLAVIHPMVQAEILTLFNDISSPSPSEIPFSNSEREKSEQNQKGKSKNYSLTGS